MVTEGRCFQKIIFSLDNIVKSADGEYEEIHVRV